jgi:hypothetical protein
MGNIAVGKYDGINALVPAQLFEPCLFNYRYAIRIEIAGQRSGIITPGNVGYLRGGEGHDFSGWVVAIHPVEIMKITPGGTHDDDARSSFLFRHWPYPFYTFGQQPALMTMPELPLLQNSNNTSSRVSLGPGLCLLQEISPFGRDDITLSLLH